MKKVLILILTTFLLVTLHIGGPVTLSLLGTGLALIVAAFFVISFTGKS